MVLGMLGVVGGDVNGMSRVLKVGIPAASVSLYTRAMETVTISENLRRLRVARGLGQEQLAAQAGLSREGYRKIEAAESLPRSATLTALAAALQAPLHDLVRPVAPMRRVRFRSTRKMKRREQVLAAVANWLEDYAALEKLVGDHRPFQLEGLAMSLPETGAERARAAAAAARQSLGLAPGEQIRDICGLLEATGVKVYPLKVESDSFFGLSVGREDGGPAIVVNSWDRISVERWIFSAAHELGHLLLHLDAFDVARTEEEQVEEREANVFAASFLMPDAVFWSEWHEARGLPFVDRVLKVKRIFRVSYATVLHRLGEREQSPSDLWKRFRGELRRRTGRPLLKTDEPDALPPSAFRDGYPVPLRSQEPDRLSPSDFAEDRLPALVRRAIEEERITLGRGAEILGLTLVNMRELAASWVD